MRNAGADSLSFGCSLSVCSPSIIENFPRMLYESVSDWWGGNFRGNSNRRMLLFLTGMKALLPLAVEEEAWREEATRCNEDEGEAAEEVEARAARERSEVRARRRPTEAERGRDMA